MFSREPVVWIQAIQAIAVGILPVLAVFGILDWSTEQFGAVEALIVLVAGVLGGLAARSNVKPVVWDEVE